MRIIGNFRSPRGKIEKNCFGNLIFSGNMIHYIGSPEMRQKNFKSIA